MQVFILHNYRVNGREIRLFLRIRHRALGLLTRRFLLLEVVGNKVEKTLQDFVFLSGYQNGVRMAHVHTKR